VRSATFGLLGRTIFREIFTSSFLGAILFTLIVFLQLANSLFEYLVSGSGSPRTVAYLFALVLPQAVPYAVPLGVLVGTLITLSRMSADGEITAMRAAGVPGRRVAPPILAFACFATLAGAACSLWLTPWAIRVRYAVENDLIAHELTAAVRERIFEEQFPNKILYVSEVPQSSGPISRWRGVFLADVTPPDQRSGNDSERGDSPMITLATEAIAEPDAPHNRVQLKFQSEHTYYTGKKPGDYYTKASADNQETLQAQKPDPKQNSHPAREMDTLPLYRFAYDNHDAPRLDVLEARIELHQRLAFPVACILLALTGIPLGITTRRAGKSSAVVLTVALAFVYEMGMISMIRMAGQGTIPAGIAVWIPNLLFALFGLIMLARLESPGDRDVLGRLGSALRSLRAGTLERAARLPRRAEGRFAWLRFPVLVHIVDTYVLSSFLFYFGVWLVSFVLMYQVFNFFELLEDMIRNHPPTAHVLAYFMYLTPRLIEYFTPLAVLAAVLVVFGVLAKNNEITAFKACGISSYRLAAPVLAGGLCLSGSLYAFNERWVPWADRQQDGFYSEIKGKPPQTFLNPQKKWVYNSARGRIFYYKGFDGTVMSGVNVYELDQRKWRLKRHIYSERARWEPGLNKWVYENGWSRDINGDTVHLDAFPGATRTFAELDETPDYFVQLLQQNVQSEQMNTQELGAYISELDQSGFNTLPLQVELQRKFSVPLFAFILAAVSIPFAFLAGNRGAMAGVGISLAIYLAYYTSQEVAGQMGSHGYLQPRVSAWAPDVVFSLFALYFLGRMRT
jgi:LPS export ABC transporter permease LptG/LPS export ABC transporter permease LptF